MGQCQQMSQQDRQRKPQIVSLDTKMKMLNQMSASINLSSIKATMSLCNNVSMLEYADDSDLGEGQNQLAINTSVGFNKCLRNFSQRMREDRVGQGQGASRTYSCSPVRLQRKSFDQDSNQKLLPLKSLQQRSSISQTELLSQMNQMNQNVDLSEYINQQIDQQEQQQECKSIKSILKSKKGSSKSSSVDKMKVKFAQGTVFGSQQLHRKKRKSVSKQ